MCKYDSHPGATRLCRDQEEEVQHGSVETYLQMCKYDRQVQHELHDLAVNFLWQMPTGISTTVLAQSSRMQAVDRQSVFWVHRSQTLALGSHEPDCFLGSHEPCIRFGFGDDRI